jgi:hypothetical protein
MEVRKGLVYPLQTLHDGIHISTSAYAVVKLDMVHENAKKMKLEMLPYDTMLNLWDAITRRAQWRRTSIDVDPSVVAATSATTSQPHPAPPGSIFPETQTD